MLARVTDLQAQNMGLNLQLIELEEERLQKGTESDEFTDADDDVIFD
jgi:hypothetical protein